MRVLVATTHRAVVGGVETYLRAVLPLLRGRGLELGVLTAFGPAPGQADILDGCSDVPAWVNDLSAAVAFRPDVVFTHDLPDMGMDAALVERFPAVRYAHNYGGMCVSGTKCHAAPGWSACSRRLGPGCLGLYVPRRCGGLNPLTTLRLYRGNRRRQGLLPRYRSVLVASRHMAAEATRNGAERVEVVPLFSPGVEPDAKPPPPRPRTDRVLFVGRITPLKGWRELATALPRASAALGRTLTLVVAGDGPDRAAFGEEARRLGLPSEFLGWVNRERIQAEMRAADLLAVPSVWPEPFGLVGIEAGCVGLPAVGFGTGGIPDWLVPGVSGESAPGERPMASELADAIVRALTDDAHHRLAVGAWETARRFTAAAHLGRLVPVLTTAAGA